MAFARINIKKLESIVANGRREDKETPYYSAWAETRDLYGAELYEAISIKLENTIAFRVRYCKKIKEMQHSVKLYVIEYDGHRYELYAVDFGHNEKNYVTLKANCVS